MANAIAVSISVDTADLQVKRAIMSAELKAATKDLNAFAKEAASSGSTEALREGMLASASAAEKARASIAQVNVELAKTALEAKPAVEHLEHGFASASVSVREMGIQLRESIGAIGEMREAMMAFGELLIAAFALEQIHEMAEKMGDAAEHVQQLSQQLGLTTEQVQVLQAAAAATDTPFETMAKAMSLLDKKFETDPKVFKKLGIDIKAGADQMDILSAVMQKFNGMDDGPKKTALALALMGKNGAAMIPFLNEGAAGLEHYNRLAEEYGAKNQAATEAGGRLAESMDEGKIAFMGLGQTMTEAFAPLLTTMADGFNGLVKSITASYESGGAMAIVFDGIVNLFEGFGEIINAVGAAFYEMFSGVGGGALDWGNIIKGVIEAVVIAFKAVVYAVVFVADAVKASFDVIAAAGIWLWGKLNEVLGYIGIGITATGQAFQLFAKLTNDALTLNWGKIASDWNSGMTQLDGVVRARGAQIVADAKATSEQAQSWFNAAGGIATGFKGFSASFWQTQHTPEATGIKIKKPKDTPTDLTSGKEKKPKKEKDDLVQQLDADLTAKKLAWEKENDAREVAIAFSLQAEADYWSKILQRTDLSAKDRAEIEKKYLAVHGQIIKERIAIVIDGYKQELTEADKNAAAKLEIANRELAYIGRTYGLESKEFAQAQAEIVKIKKEAVQQQRDLDDLRDKAIDKANLDHITAAEEAAKHRVALGVETDAQLLAQQRAFEDARFAIERAAAVRARGAVNGKDDPVKARQLDLQLEQIERDHQAKMTAIDQQGALERKRIAQQTFRPFADSLAQMVTLQKGFMSTINDMWKSFGSLVSQVITKWTENFLVALVTQEFAAERAHLKQVVHLAKQAAAGAYNAVVGIPIVGPILAPIAAATAFVGVMAFSAEGGYDVPRGGLGIDGRGGQLGIVHPEEMLLPASLANGVRSMVGGGGWALPAGIASMVSLPSGRSAANYNAPNAANDGGGGNTYNFHVNAIDGQSVKRVLMDNKHHVAGAVSKSLRDGFRR